jgi:hypothetical protein
MAVRTTWKPHTKHGELTTREDLPDSVFAFPDQVKDVSDADRDRAFANIKKAAEHYDVEVSETGWRQLGKKPHTPNPAQ